MAAISGGATLPLRPKSSIFDLASTDSQPPFTLKIYTFLVIYSVVVGSIDVPARLVSASGMYSSLEALAPP